MTVFPAESGQRNKSRFLSVLMWKFTAENGFDVEIQKSYDQLSKNGLTCMHKMLSVDKTTVYSQRKVSKIVMIEHLHGNHHVSKRFGYLV